MAVSLQRTWISSCTSKLRLASTYKAAVLKQAGQFLQLEEKGRPKLRKHQVRLKVHYCSVNSIDCISFREPSVPLPFVPGYELAGEVIETGKGVVPDQIIKGEKVAALSLAHLGGFAEECVLNVDEIWRLPSNVQVKDAAVIMFGHSTALFAFSKLHKIKEGQNVLITADSAGLGLAAVDVAANIYKAKVLGVTDKEEMSELLRKRGAFHTLHFTPKLKTHVHAVTNKKGADVIFDAVGEHMHEVVDSCIVPGGRLLHAATFAYNTIPAPPTNTYFSLVDLRALNVQNHEGYKCIVSDTLELADQGIIGAHISATYKLSEVNEAIQYIEDKKCMGKVLISII